MSSVIHKLGGYNLQLIKTNKKIRDIATHKIVAKGKNIGNLFLIDENENVILSSDRAFEGRNYKEVKDKYSQLYNLVDQGIRNPEFKGYYTVKGDKNSKIERKFLAAVKIPNTPLYIISSIFVKPYVNPMLEEISLSENKEIDILTKDIDALTTNSIITLLSLSFLILSLLIFASIIISNWLAKKISSPIISLRNAVTKIGKGDFNTTIEEQGTIETIHLAKTFNRLGQNLKKYIKNLEKEIRQRKQVESEIEVARKIQKSILPDVTKEFQREDFSIYANLIPAKHVAGDFYDFFYLDKDQTQLVVILGDVSGKGIPAAFFMGITRTILRHECLTGKFKNPADLLEEVNKIIFADNAEFMFVTMFVAFYDTTTSQLSYANAGHHPGIRLKQDSSLEEFGSMDDALIGLFSDVTYKNGQITLEKNETIVFYTDGISEATSKTNELYGEERIQLKLKCDYEKKSRRNMQISI